MQTLRRDRAARSRAPTSSHFTNGMVPLMSPVPTVVTIHDMSLRLYPRYHPPRRVLLNRPLVDLAARRADAIITRVARAPSATSCGSTASTRIACTWSTKRRRRRSSAVRRSRRARAGPPALRAGRAHHPVRRHDRAAKEPADADRRVCRSAGAAASCTHQLVCVGPYGWLSRGIDEQHRAARTSSDAIKFTGYVPFEDLPALYSLAEMFVLSVDVRRLRPAGHRGDGLRRAGHHRPRRGACRRSAAARSSRSTPRAGRAGRRAGRAGRRAATGASSCRRSASRARATFSWERAARETLEIYRDAAQRPARAGRRRPDAASADERRAPRRQAHAPSPYATAAAASDVRRPVRPGVLPALRPEAVGGAAAVRAARRAVRRRVRPRRAATTSRSSTRCWPTSEARMGRRARSRIARASP